MPKKINLNQLASVNGGVTGFVSPKYFYTLHYKETANGDIKERFWGQFSDEEKATQKKLAEAWCKGKRFIFVDLVAAAE